MIHIDLTFYAQLREQAGSSETRFSTTAKTVADLYQELKQVHGFTLDEAVMKAAVNDAFCDWGQPLRDGDSVTFVPPVAGG